jgi:hypothetical protein
MGKKSKRKTKTKPSPVVADDVTITSDEELFKDPPAKEDCPICFLPMPIRLFSSASLPPATISSMPINDFAIANQELATEPMEKYYSCCGKRICRGCAYSFCKSGNDGKCPFCNSDRAGKTDEENNDDFMKQVEANDPFSIYMLAGYYLRGLRGVEQDHAKALELLTKAADLGCSKAHNNLGVIYEGAGNLKKFKFHVEAAAMAGDEVAQCNLGIFETQSRNMERARKHFTIAASVIQSFQSGRVSRESSNSILAAYNNSCAKMRSEARDAYIRFRIESTVPSASCQCQ